MHQHTEKLIIFDTTLRDGEQSPGASMTQEEKVRIARTLEKMQVDVIEAGFAVASPGDFAAVQAVAENIQNSRICSLSRAIAKDIETAAAAIKPANAGRIHSRDGHRSRGPGPRSDGRRRSCGAAAARARSSPIRASTR